MFIFLFSFVNVSSLNISEEAKNRTVFDSECLEVQSASPDGVQGGLFKALNDTEEWVDLLSQPLLPSCPFIRYDDSIFTSTVTTEVNSQPTNFFYKLGLICPLTASVKTNYKPLKFGKFLCPCRVQRYGQTRSTINKGIRKKCRLL